MSLTKQQVEQALLFRACRANTKTDEEAVLHFECIQDLLKIQESAALINLTAIRTTKGRRSKTAIMFREVIGGRLQQLADETNGVH